MRAIRLLLAQRHLAVLLCAATLLLKLLVPTGYMVATTGGQLSLIVCGGTQPRAAAPDMHDMHANMADHGGSHEPAKSKDHGKAEMPCVFSSLSAAVLGAIDPVQLAALIAFVMALGAIAVALPTLAEPTRLRPPLRGPPIFL